LGEGFSGVDGGRDFKLTGRSRRKIKDGFTKTVADGLNRIDSYFLRLTMNINRLVGDADATSIKQEDGDADQFLTVGLTPER